jgi:hypothetical protein
MARVALVAFALSAGLLAYVKLGPELSPRLEDLDATPSGFSDPTLGEDISADLDKLLRPAMVRMRAQAKVHQDIVSQIYQVNTAQRAPQHCACALCSCRLLQDNQTLDDLVRPDMERMRAQAKVQQGFIDQIFADNSTETGTGTATESKQRRKVAEEMQENASASGGSRIRPHPAGTASLCCSLSSKSATLCRATCNLCCNLCCACCNSTEQGAAP